MSDGKGGDDLRVFDELVAGKGWSLAPDASQPNTVAAPSDELEVIPDPFGSPFPKGMPPLPRSMPPLPVSAAALPAGVPRLPPSMPPLPASALPPQATSADDGDATEPGDPMVEAMTAEDTDNLSDGEATNEPVEAHADDAGRAEEAIAASDEQNEDEEQIVDSDDLEPPLETVAAADAPLGTEERLDATSAQDAATEENDRTEEQDRAEDEQGEEEREEQDREGEDREEDEREGERDAEERDEEEHEPAEEPLAAADESSDATDSSDITSRLGDVTAMPAELPELPAETSAVAVESLTPPIARETVRGDWMGPPLAVSPPSASDAPPSGRASATPPPPWARTTSSTRPMPIMPVARTSIVPPPPPRSARAAGTPLPPPVASSLPPLPKPRTLSGAMSATSDEPVHASHAADESNPFLAPIKAPEEGGPASLLPPPPTQASSVSAPPQKRTAKPPPALRTTTRSAKPLPPPPPRATTSSMEPPPALSGTVPPFRRRSLDSEISALQTQARRRKMVTFGAVAALGIAAFYIRKSTTGTVEAAQPVEMASLHATAKHDGIKLVLDGKEIGALPQDIKDLAPGEHSIVFEGSDRYESEKNTITLAPNEKKELELVSLKVSRGSATFDVKPPGTTVELVSGDERRTITDFSHPVDVDTSKTWSLEASKPGFKPLSIPVTFDDQAEKTFVVALTEPIHSAPAPVETAETPAPTDTTTEVALAKTDKTDKGDKGEKGDKLAHAALAKTEPTSNKPVPAAPQAQALAVPAKAQGPVVPAAAPPAAKAPTSNCTLNINSLPTSKVTLDGHAIGFTPKLGVSVPAGTHSIMLVSDSGRKATSATCKAGETKTVAIRMMLQ